MALIKAETAQGFSALPALRQLGLMIGLAASVALGVAVVLWSQKPSYSLLYGNLTEQDSAQVLEALQKSGIPYKVDDGSGAVMVPSGKVHEARLKLASEGLPKGQGIGYELLDKEQEMGASQFIEQARYQRALEVELARSIGTMRDVKAVRVHLAIPKRTVFIRKRDKASASVVLELYPGRTLGDQQVAAIVHLVASSIPSLSPERVTVVDQNGTLLSNGMNDRTMAMTSNQFNYTRKLEETYRQRIEELITPIVGPGRVRAQVVASLDFTHTEKTLEQYNPDLPALRSEQVIEENRANANTNAQGVPGALSNQPPAEQNAAAPAGEAEAQGTSSARQTSKQAIRNYELDKTISHIVSPGARLQRLSVAVLVDDLRKVNDNGEVTRTPLKPEEIQRITTLVKDAVGFDARRGDTVNVINAAFHVPEQPEPLPEPPIWEQPWVWDVGKQALGALFILIMVFGVLKPILRSLAEKGEAMQQQMATAGGPPGTLPPGEGEAQAALPGAPAQENLPPPENQVDKHLEVAKEMVKEDPARVAQVVRGWVGNDG